MECEWRIKLLYTCLKVCVLREQMAVFLAVGEACKQMALTLWTISWLCEILSSRQVKEDALYCDEFLYCQFLVVR